MSTHAYSKRSEASGGPTALDFFMSFQFDADSPAPGPADLDRLGSLATNVLSSILDDAGNIHAALVKVSFILDQDRVFSELILDEEIGEINDVTSLKIDYVENGYYVANGYIRVFGVYFAVRREGESVNLYPVTKNELDQVVVEHEKVERRTSSKWSEAARDKKQVKLRLPPHVINEVDSQAEALGIDRNAWITMAIHKALKPS